MRMLNNEGERRKRRKMCPVCGFRHIVPGSPEEEAEQIRECPTYGVETPLQESLYDAGYSD